MSGEITRFSKGKPCPVCGGTDGDRRGEGTRCHGFLSSDGDWVHCSREEFAGRARFEVKTSTYLHRARGKCPCGEEHAPGEEGRPVPSRRPRKIGQVYRYRDADGQVVHETVRYDDPKTFRQRRPLPGGGEAWDLRGIEPVLYNLPGLLGGDPEAAVWIVEGEKDADRLISLGFLATTCAMGAGKWRDSYSAVLGGRHCYVLPDNDDAGRAHAQAVARSLHGTAASVRVVELPGLAPKGDVSDWLDAGGTVAQLGELAYDTPAWEPSTEPPPATNGNGHKNGNGNGVVNFAEMTPEQLGLIPVSRVRSANCNWLWEYRLAAGEMALVAGEGGVGKSMFMMACAAAISTGGPWPAGIGSAPVGTVIIVSAEDHPETTIRPRLQAMGADLDRVIICKARATVEQDGVRYVNAMSLQDRSYWSAVFDSFADTRLFIVDPVPSYLGRGINDRQNSEIRQVLEPFIEDVIRPRGICFYANTHLSKTIDGGRSPIQRITGSIAYTNIPRNVHVITRDPDDRGRRYFSQAKCNNAPDDLPAIAYRVEQRQVESSEGAPVDTAIAVFEEKLLEGFDLADVMAPEKGRRGPQPVKTRKLADWLWERLQAAPGGLAIRDLADAAREARLLPPKIEGKPVPSISSLYDAARLLSDLHPGYEAEDAMIESGRGTFRRELKGWRLKRTDDDGDDDPIIGDDPADPVF